MRFAVVEFPQTGSSSPHSPPPPSSLCVLWVLTIPTSSLFPVSVVRDFPPLFLRFRSEYSVSLSDVSLANSDLIISAGPVLFVLLGRSVEG